MALNNFNELNDMHKSFLQEIGNMGAANAATEVSNMFSSPTDISTPEKQRICCVQIRKRSI